MLCVLVKKAGGGGSINVCRLLQVCGMLLVHLRSSPTNSNGSQHHVHLQGLIFF